MKERKQITLRLLKKTYGALKKKLKEVTSEI